MWTSSSVSPKRAEDDGVFADVVARPNRVHADLVRRPFADQALAAVDELGNVHRLLDDAGKVHGRPARRVLLEPVVPLHDFHVEALALECDGRVLDQLEQQVHDQAHARGEQDGGRVGGRLDLLALSVRVPGRGDDEWDLARLAGLDDVDCAFGRREVDRDVRLNVERQG